MEGAKRRYVTDQLERQLLSSASRWEQVERVRRYLREAERSVARLAKDEDRTQAQEWLAWAREWVQLSDPLIGPLRMPEIPDPKPEDLKPYLGGLSPYGPSSAW